MMFLVYLLQIAFGVFWIWLGAFQLITSMLPKDTSIYVAEKHGEWIRENVFKLPQIKEGK